MTVLASLNPARFSALALKPPGVLKLPTIHCRKRHLEGVVRTRNGLYVLHHPSQWRLDFTLKSH